LNCELDDRVRQRLCLRSCRPLRRAFLWLAGREEPWSWALVLSTSEERTGLPAAFAGLNLGRTWLSAPDMSGIVSEASCGVAPPGGGEPGTPSRRRRSRRPPRCPCLPSPGRARTSEFPAHGDPRRLEGALRRRGVAVGRGRVTVTALLGRRRSCREVVHRYHLGTCRWFLGDIGPVHVRWCRVVSPDLGFPSRRTRYFAITDAASSDAVPREVDAVSRVNARGGFGPRVGDDCNVEGRKNAFGFPFGVPKAGRTVVAPVTPFATR
jgi:hypothetical protein